MATISAKATLRERYSEMKNDDERSYAAYLDLLLASGEIRWWKYEGIRLVLAPKTSLTVDFFVVNKNDELEAHEYKGRWRDDARAKLKVAAAMFPFKFIAVTKEAKKRGGGFLIETFRGLADAA